MYIKVMLMYAFRQRQLNDGHDFIVVPSLLRETTPYIVSGQSTQNVSYVFMPPSAQNNVTMGYVHRGDA